MQRLPQTVLVLALLVATAVAIARTEGLKLEKSPISGPHLDAVFSPVCACSSDVAHISIRLVKTGRLTMSVQNASGNVVRSLVRSRRFRHNRLHFTWNGRDAAGRIVPDGSYRIRVLLSGQHRAITLPTAIRVDTHPPVLKLISAAPPVVTPNGGRNARHVDVKYSVNEAAHVGLQVKGTVRVRARFTRLTGTLVWFGMTDGTPVPPGDYRLSLVARDLAGNLSRVRPGVSIRVEYIALARHEIRVRARTRFGVRIVTGLPSVHWRLGAASGMSRAGLLVVKAGKPGLYTLVVSSGPYRDEAQVQVVRR